ncbi:MAG: DUF1015 domain-containing protein [Candidatus Omnitrophota bacterium]
MTKISPFKALLYNQEKVNDLSKVVCPPYDIISKTDQDRYYARHPFNLIRLILGKDLPQDNKAENKYTRAEKLFNDWIKERVFKLDDKESVYFYLQQYQIKGEHKERLGFISLMRLEDRDHSTVFAHENTHLGPKEDRFQLIKKVKANLSPIFTLFIDEKRLINRIFGEHLKDTTPLISLTDQDRVIHKLWRLSDKALVEKLKKSMEDRQIFIADGHHRYEVALLYRDYMAKKSRNFNKEARYNFIMTYFADNNARDITILPIHRVVKRMPEDILGLSDLFYIERAKTKDELFLFLAKAGLAEHAFGLYHNKKFWLLRLRNERIVDKIVKDGSSDYHRLDVVILHKLVLEKIFGLRDEDVIFVKDEYEAINMVDEGNAEAVFLLNSTKINQIRSIALNNERMPPKSTYFYPKLLSGSVIHKF